MISKALRISFKKYKINPVIRTLILTDLTFWSASNLLAPIFAVFVVEELTGGSIEIVGIAATLYLFARSLTEIPVGIILDKLKGEKDDLFSIMIGNFLTGIIFFTFPFVVKSVEALYIYQVLLGAVFALSAPGWYTIFTRHIDKDEEGFEWGLYDVVISIGMASTAAIGGFLAAEYGFDIVFYLVGGFMVLSGFVPLLVKDMVKER
ncbi:MAG TPA: MFS transporter [bacterium]|nr:MFS transporter [bacterium]